MVLRPWSTARQRGFALLIVVTLLAFITLLLLGLAAFTRIETSVAGNMQRQAQARENALLALNVALGQLQAHAGPDKRVTATAEAFSNRAGTSRYVGVWPSDPADDPDGDPLTPLTWLVSGNELLDATGAKVPLAVTPSTATTTLNGVALVSTNTSGTANDVLARLVPITATGVPGVSPTAPPTIFGRYAWWVGDQGVKAPVAVPDISDKVDYVPFDSVDLRSRIRQQISLGAGAANASGNPVFEPRDASNAALVADQKVSATNQIAFLRKDPAFTGTFNFGTVQQNFHAWSPNNFAVLANTRLGGLRQDLSLDPTLLGSAFASWANYATYIEDAAAPTAPAPLQAYISDPLRRRYVMQPASSGYGIAPVLSFFGLSFSLRNNAGGTGLEVATRCVVGLWNPYSSALVPEDLELVITSGLPDVQVKDQAGNSVPVTLQSLLGGSAGLKFLLPFTPNVTDDDHSSWLPGRVYNWSAPSNPGVSGNPGNPMTFYVRDSTPGSGSGVIWPAGAPLAPSPPSAKVFRQCFISSPTSLALELRRASDGEKLAEFNSPAFQAIANGTNQIETDGKGIDFAFLFRLPDTGELPTGQTATWLQAKGRDPRENPFPGAGYIVPGGNGDLAEQFGGPTKFQFDSSYPDLLLDRDVSTGASYNEDVPVFELPRAPLLSMGSLQHFRISGTRPFSIANSWAGGVQLNGVKIDELFDRFCFSGVVSGITPATVNGSMLPPNSLLKVLRNPATGSAATLADLQGAPNAQSSKFFLQGGAFNLNSVTKAAWIAVLRSVRFQVGKEFSYIDASSGTGTAADSTTNLSEPFLTNSHAAVFPRFAQSAQEVFKADASYAQSQSSFTTTAAPIINTPLFRRGIRTLSSADVAALADQIVTLVRQKHTASGPFRHLEEFLNPSSLFVDASGQQVSLLEKAIEGASLNDASKFDTPSAEFSSQWLIQADIMTALAPVLFPRSDTFVIRAYGEAVNPATTNTE
ncbi:MAG: hypothetical protein ABIQ12_13735, partial [Opitutaceae bacterium]